MGDFNSTPLSNVVRLFLGEPPIQLNHHYETYSKMQEFFLSTNFKLRSAYKFEDISFTNFTIDFKGVIDYIFVSEDLIPQSHLNIPRYEECSAE